MTTEELVNMDWQEFEAAVRALDAAGCERHARDLFHRLGGTGTFEDYLAAVVGTAVLYHGSPEEQCAEIFVVTKTHFPHVLPGYDVSARLVVLTMRVMAHSLPPVGPRTPRNVPAVAAAAEPTDASDLRRGGNRSCFARRTSHDA